VGNKKNIILRGYLGSPFGLAALRFEKNREQVFIFFYFSFLFFFFFLRQPYFESFSGGPAATPLRKRLLKIRVTASALMPNIFESLPML